MPLQRLLGLGIVEEGDILRRVEEDEVGSRRLPSHLRPAARFPDHPPPMMEEGDDPLRAEARVYRGLPVAAVEARLGDHAGQDCLLQLVEPDRRLRLQVQQRHQDVQAVAKVVAPGSLEFVAVINK
jgi:hypothetical protein